MIAREHRSVRQYEFSSRLPRYTWQAFHLAAEGLQRCHCGIALHLAQNHEAGLALDQRAHRRAVEGALDQVSLL